MKAGHTKETRDTFFNTGNMIIEITLTLYSSTTNNIVFRTEQHRIPNDILHCTLHQDYEGGQPELQISEGRIEVCLSLIGQPSFYSCRS